MAVLRLVRSVVHDGVVADLVPAVETYELRHRVLRRGKTPADVKSADDLDPGSGHYAVKIEGVVVATGTVRRKPSPRGEERAWQIRGMAVQPELRGQGLGSDVLTALICHAESLGGGLIWCYARIGARTLYVRHGFGAEGEAFEDAVAGSQVYMARSRSHPA